MTNGIKALRRIQMGAEAPAGTPVPATTMYRGQGLLKDDLNLVFPDETVGYLSGLDRTYISELGGSMQLTGEATFEQWPHIGNAGIGLVVPTTDVGGSGYIWTYTLPTVAGLATTDIQTYTIEGGDNQQEEEMEFSFVQDFEMSGKAGEAWMLTSTWMGRQITASSFTASSDVAVPTVEEMLFSKSKLYIDSTSDAIGTTQKSSTFLEGSIKVKTGLETIKSGDGNLYFSSIKNVGPEVVLSITFEHDGTATAEKALRRSQTARQIRILCNGSALASAGTYTYKTWIANLAGKWESFEKLDELNGNDIIKATFRARYQSVAALFASFVVVNELSVMP